MGVVIDIGGGGVRRSEVMAQGVARKRRVDSISNAEVTGNGARRAILMGVAPARAHDANTAFNTGRVDCYPR